MKNKFIIGLLSILGIQNIVAQDVTLPFEFYENKYLLVKLPAEQPEKTYLFDTGSSTILFGADRVNLDKNTVIEGVKASVNNLSEYQSTLGKPFDGIIGNDILKDYVTKIDFENKKIELYKNSFPDKTGYTGLSFELKNGLNIPQFPINIELENGLRYTGNILFNSGLGEILVLNTPFVEENTMTVKLRNKFVTNTNVSRTTTTRIRNLKLSSFVFNNLPIHLSSTQEGINANKDFMGVLGNEIFSRFDVIIDYKDQIIYLKPNGLHKNKFEMPVSPISLAYNGNDIEIYSVVESSEAAEKGLKKGQKIISMNGKTSDIATYRALLKRKNKNVTIKYIDEGTEKTVKIKLKELL